MHKIKRIKIELWFDEESSYVYACHSGWSRAGDRVDNNVSGFYAGGHNVVSALDDMMETYARYVRDGIISL